MGTLLRLRLMRIFVAGLALQICLIYPFDICYRTDPTPELDEIVDAIIADFDDQEQGDGLDLVMASPSLQTTTAQDIVVPDFPDMEKALPQDFHYWEAPAHLFFPLVPSLDSAEINSCFAEFSPRAPPLPASRFI
ncbi:MAG TPA: hypothetical protein VGK99_14970 [Acidobacteriota bacterium]|jgi:hypothetical protein